MESYLSEKLFTAETSDLDPTNEVFKRPDQRGLLEFRPEFKYQKVGDDKLIFRPQLLYYYEVISFDKPSRQENKGEIKWNISDAYWERSWTDRLRTTIGLQVYQWGSAEFLNASNPLYHLNSQQRSFLYKEKGKVLIRMNLDYSRNWNQVLVYEPMSNTEGQWIAETEFVTKGLVKTEWIADSGVDLVGIVVGKEERSQGFIGEYFSYAPSEGFTFYLDAKHVESSVAYYPEANLYGTESLNYNLNARNGWTTFGVAGVRKEWSQLDLRFEYIHNSAGWTSGELESAKQSLKNLNPDVLKNFARFSRPGLELLGRGYGYISVRIFNLGKIGNQSIAIRWLQSAGDGTSTVMSVYDWEAFDAFNFFFEGYGTFGKKGGDLNLLSQQSYLLGVRYSL